MLSPRRRQVLIGGALTAALPAVSFAQGIRKEALVLSGSAAPWATLTIGAQKVTVDADGRFFVVTDTSAVGNLKAERDAEGTWRATVALAA